LIERIAADTVIGFNLSFDWFHLCQTYTTLLLSQDKDAPPDRLEYAANEALGRDGPCLKPASAFDIMLHARKGSFQTTMKRKSITIKRVPTVLAFKLRDELDRRLVLPDIMFAKNTDRTKRWVVRDITDDLGGVNSDFKNLELNFNPSNKLKDLAMEAGLTEKVMFFDEIAPPAWSYPNEVGYAPFCT
jgi:hypothetical protein